MQKLRKWTVVFLGMILVLFFAPLAAGQDVLFTSAFDGSAQYYIERHPDGFDPNTPADLLVFLHGHGSDRTQIDADRAECRAVRQAAARYHTILISCDYRAKTSWMGPAAEADMCQILAQLKEQYKIQRTIFVGGSMGASASLTFAALHPELVSGVAAFNPLANHLEYENFQDAIAESFGGSKQERPMEYKNRSAEYFPERFTMPLAITLGGQDTVVPPDSAKRLIEIVAKLQPNTLLIFRPETGHETDDADSTAALDFVFQSGK